jgi:hypothetical protein
MKKKQYIKPSMKVYEMKQQAALLVGSSGGSGNGDRGRRSDDWLGYTPAEHHLA